MEYKRLTNQNQEPKTIFCFSGSMQDFKIYKRLQEIEDKIENGTLKEIPCKIGDTLYTNMRWQGDYMRKENAPYPVIVVFIGINDNVDMGGGVINIVNEKGRMWQIDFLDIGETVFLTREEAEKRLKEIQNG
jgi:hypothetical protein